MTNQIATTIEQSQRLIACGVNPDSADMCWEPQGSIDHPISVLTTATQLGLTGWGGCKLAWSLSALLALMPQSIKVDSLEFNIEITAGWRVSYVYYDDILECFDATDIIECCVKAVEWLTKYGYNLNKP